MKHKLHSIRRKTSHGHEVEKRRWHHIFVEALGWYGTVAILVAYALLSFSYIDAQSLWYQGLNLTGGLGIVIEALSLKAYPPAVLNIIWSIIGVISIVRVLLH